MDVVEPDGAGGRADEELEAGGVDGGGGGGGDGVLLPVGGDGGDLKEAGIVPVRTAFLGGEGDGAVGAGAGPKGDIVIYAISEGAVVLGEFNVPVGAVGCGRSEE